MQTELEKTQLEIAKAQLAQEQIKLSKMQRNQQALSSLGQGAVVLGEGAKKGGAAVFSFFVQWVICLLVVAATTVGILVVLSLVNNSNRPEYGFATHFGHVLGFFAAPHFFMLLLCPFALMLGLSDGGKFRAAYGMACATGAAVFFIWYKFFMY